MSEDTKIWFAINGDEEGYREEVTVDKFPESESELELIAERLGTNYYAERGLSEDEDIHILFFRNEDDAEDFASIYVRLEWKIVGYSAKFDDKTKGE